MTKSGHRFTDRFVPITTPTESSCCPRTFQPGISWMHAHWKPPGESQFPTCRSSRQCNHKGYANKMNSLYFSVFFCSFSIIFLIMNACISWFLGILLYSSIPQIARKSVHLCVILPWITMIASCGRLTLHPVCYKAKGSCLVGEKV